MSPRRTRPPVALALLAGLSLPAVTTGIVPLPAMAAPQTQAGYGFDVGNLDRTANPADDFYQFAVGGWLAKNPIPPEYPRWGSFQGLADKNNLALKAILEEAAKAKAKPGTVEQKIGDFYAAFMDTAAIEAAGLQPLQAELARIRAVRDRAGLVEAIAHFHAAGVPVFFGFGYTQDYKDSTRVIGEAGQGGLGMPDRDYYTKTDARSRALQAAYVKHVARMFELAGDKPQAAAKQAETVMALETALAKASMTRVEQRDPHAVYHIKDRAGLAAMSPGFDWPRYFKTVGRPDLASINVAQPAFFQALDEELGKLEPADWQTYMRWHLLHAMAGVLPEAFVAEDFAFASKFSGAKVNQPRWKRAVRLTDRKLGEALGQVYVKKHFSPESKAQVRQLVDNLVAALRDDLQTLDWMSPATRKAAAAKLAAFNVKIGYPDKWKDYSGLTIDRGPFVANLMRANRFAWTQDMAKIGKPVDRHNWWMSPQTVNAYYDPLMNEIVFPAGILQPPFFDPKADDPVNYGAIGAVIGHEITHGFDDQGAQFDGQGNLKNWWTPEDKQRFDARAAEVIKQFDAYTVEDGVHVNGKLVVGESIADLGGLTIAYKGLEKALAGKPRTLIDGFTPEQRFFLGYAQVWAENSRPEYLRTLVNTDPHPPSRFRVNGPLANLPFFAKAFGAKPGDAMVRKDAVRIW